MRALDLQCLEALELSSNLSFRMEPPDFSEYPRCDQVFSVGREGYTAPRLQKLTAPFPGAIMRY
jgi:hypothetical protein